MMVSRLPIRWRLTIWYAAFLAALIVLSGFTLYFGLRHILSNSFHDQVESNFALALSSVRIEGDRVTFDLNARDNQSQDERFIRLFDLNGITVVDTSATAGPIPMDRSLIRDALTGRSRTTTASGRDGQMEIVTAPVRENDTIVGVLQVGLSRGDMDEVLSALILVLGIVAPLAVVSAAAIGYVLAGRALAPVAAITRTAAGIGANDLHARLNLPLPDDEIGRLARTFDAMLARIEDAFERQRRFTGDAAHELRTPLSLMRGQVDLALTRPRSPEDYRAALVELDQPLERLTGLVSTLLNLARADSGRFPLVRASMDLTDTITLLLEQYGPLAEEAGIKLQDESTPVRLFADEDLLIQVLVNLLENSLAHTPIGGAITVGCRLEDTMARLWVADTGSGIATEHQPRIFDRFYRVDAGRTRAHGGTGLGLAICKAIAEEHDGTIELTSQIGKGTRVELLLPQGLESHGGVRPAGRSQSEMSYGRLETVEK